MTKTHYQFSPKVTISAIVAVATIILTLTAKTWSGGYIASQQISRIDALEKRQDISEQKQISTDKTLEVRAQVGEQYFSRLSVVEANISNLKDSINEIKTSVMKIDDNMQKIAERVRK